METNLQEQLSKIREENELLNERLRQRQIQEELSYYERQEAKQRKLKESNYFEWLNPYVELLNRSRYEPGSFGPYTGYRSRDGRNYPIFQSEQELALLRAPARLLLSTNSYAIGLMTGLASYVIGTGMTSKVVLKDSDPKIPKALTKELQKRIVDKFLEKNQWYGGEMPSLEMECFWRSCEDGETIMVLYGSDDGIPEVRIREPEDLTQPPNEKFSEYSFGIRVDPKDIQKHLAYYLRHGPETMEGEELSPERVLHIRRNSKRTIKRGVTDFSFSTYDSLFLGNTLIMNLSDAACQQASIVGVREHQVGNKDDIETFIQNDIKDRTTKDPLTQTEYPIRRHFRGGFEDIPKSMRYVDGPHTTNQSGLIQVLNTCLLGAGQRWNAPEWLANGQAGNVNHASSLTTESPFIRNVLYNQKVYAAVFRECIRRAVQYYVTKKGFHFQGRVYRWEELDKLIDIQVIPHSPEMREKNSETQRAMQEIQAGVLSPQEYMMQQGREPEKVFAETLAFKKQQAEIDAKIQEIQTLHQTEMQMRMQKLQSIMGGAQGGMPGMPPMPGGPGGPGGDAGGMPPMPGGDAGGAPGGMPPMPPQGGPEAAGGEGGMPPMPPEGGDANAPPMPEMPQEGQDGQDMPMEQGVGGDEQTDDQPPTPQTDEMPQEEPQAEPDMEGQDGGPTDFASVDAPDSPEQPIPSEEDEGSESGQAEGYSDLDDILAAMTVDPEDGEKPLDTQEPKESEEDEDDYINIDLGSPEEGDEDKEKKDDEFEIEL